MTSHGIGLVADGQKMRRPLSCSDDYGSRVGFEQCRKAEYAQEQGCVWVFLTSIRTEE